MLIVIYDPTNCPILPVLAGGYQRHLAFVAPLGIVVAKSTRGPRTAERRATRPKCGQFSRGHTVPPLHCSLARKSSSNEPVNLTNRQADVAIRVVYERSALPLNLYSLKGTGAVRRCVHVPRHACRVARGSA
jgi:hypothetical protein